MCSPVRLQTGGWQPWQHKPVPCPAPPSPSPAHQLCSHLLPHPAPSIRSRCTPRPGLLLWLECPWWFPQNTTYHSTGPATNAVTFSRSRLPSESLASVIQLQMAPPVRGSSHPRTHNRSRSCTVLVRKGLCSRCSPAILTVIASAWSQYPRMLVPPLLPQSRLWSWPHPRHCPCTEGDDKNAFFSYAEIHVHPPSP